MNFQTNDSVRILQFAAAKEILCSRNTNVGGRQVIVFEQRNELGVGRLKYVHGGEEIPVMEKFSPTGLKRPTNVQ